MNGSVNLSNGYLRNDNNGLTKFYSNLTLNSRIDFYGIPLQVNWNLLKPAQEKFQSGHFSVSFSKENFNNFLLEKENKLKDSVNFGKSKELDTVTNLLNNLEYLTKVSGARHGLIQLQEDSIKGVITFSEYEKDSLRHIVQKHDSLKNRYYSFYNKQFSKNKLNSKISTNISRFEGDSGYSKLSNPDSLLKIKEEGKDRINSNKLAKKNQSQESNKILSKVDSLSKFKKGLLNFEKIQIGYDIINQSWISVYNYSISGSTILYNDNKYIIGFSLGKHQRYNDGSSFSLVKSSSFFTQLQDKQSFHQFQVGLNDSMAKLIVSYSGFSPSKVNGIYDQGSRYTGILNLLSQRKISDHSSIRIEVSKVLSKNNIVLENNNKKQQGLAVDVSGEKSFEKTNLSLAFQYMNISKSFRTPGNLYLVNGIQTASLKIEDYFFQQRLNGNINSSYAWSDLLRRQQTILSLKFKLTQKTSFSTKSIINSFISFPTIFKQKIYSNQIAVNSAISKVVNISVTAYYGFTVSSNKQVSKDILGTYFMTFKIKKSSIGFQLSQFYKLYGYNNLNGASLAFNYSLTLNKGMTIGLTSNFQNNKNSKIVGTNIFVSYSLSKFISTNFNFNLTNYFTESIWIPNNLNYQGQAMLTYRF